MCGGVFEFVWIGRTSSALLPLYRRLKMAGNQADPGQQIRSWLASCYASINGHPISVDSWISCTNYASGASCWLAEDVIDVSLELLRSNVALSTSDVYIASTFDSQIVYTASHESEQGNQTALARTKASLRHLAMSAITHRYCFLLVNDGFAVQQRSRGHVATAGSHWTIVLIDNHSKLASHIDPTVQAGPGRNTDFPIQTGHNGTVAQRVLSGYSIIQGLGPDGYSASTCAHAPHQQRNNRCKADHGACGPYVYAFIKYLLENKQLLDGGLSPSFSSANAVQRQNELGFNSAQTRREIQNLVHAVRLDAESKNASLQPLNLDINRLASLRACAGLVLDLLNAYQQAKNVPRRSPVQLWTHAARQIRTLYPREEQSG